MRKRTHDYGPGRRMVCALLAAALAAGLLAGCVMPETIPENTTAAPETTEPWTTEPETTEPATSEPGVTEPETTEPATSEPEVTEPETTEPETTEPKPTEPRETKPKPTEPETTEPAESAGEEWMLILVNPWNPIPEGYVDDIPIKKLSGKNSIDKRCYPDLQEMMDDCRAQGLHPRICSSFRTWEKQESLFQNKVKRLLNAGWDEDTVEDEAARAVARPGTSEHQLGLAVDIVAEENQNLNKSQEKTEVQKWLMANSWRYGWILRYPNGKSDITGVIYEPWHYRYVGKEAAKEIYEQGITLEEYLDGSAG